MTKIYIKTLVILFVLVMIHATTKAQTQIIINEFSQGPASTDNEWIELVVTKDSTDIRGVYLDKDDALDGDTTNRWDDHQVQFKSISTFQYMPKGSIIVIYKSTTGIDSTVTDDPVFDDDSILVISHTNTNFFEMSATWPSLLGSGDAFGIFNSDESGIHGIAYGGVEGNLWKHTWAAAFPSGTSWGMTDLTGIEVPGGQEISFTEGTPEAVSNAGNWTLQSYQQDSPGKLNGGNNNALPVELTSFSAVINKSSVNLIWKTETEVNNYGFEVQRSSDNKDWETLGFVNGNGNSNSPKEYNFEDNAVGTSGTYSYRLKQIDNDGTYEFSKMIEVNFGSPVSIELKQNYPNPFNPSTTINFTLPVNDAVSLIVYNAIGEQVKVLQNGLLEAGVHSFTFNGDGFPSGLYIYRLSTSSNTQVRKMMLLK